MTENVQIALIAAVALMVIVCIVVFVFRDRFQKGSIKVNQDGIQLDGENHPPSEPPELPITKVIGTKIVGHRNEVSARDGGRVEDSDIEGDKNRLNSNG